MSTPQILGWLPMRERWTGTFLKQPIKLFTMDTGQDEIRNNKTLCERAIRRVGCGIYCECGGIVRNDIFPEPFRTDTLNFLL